MNKMLIEKLHPRRFPGMSAKMAAIVGFVLGQEFTTTRIAEMVITSDAMVLARQAGDIGLNLFIGRAADLERNWSNLIDSACLLDVEKTELARLFRSRVQDHRLVNEDVEVAR